MSTERRLRELARKLREEATNIEQIAEFIRASEEGAFIRRTRKKLDQLYPELRLPPDSAHRDFLRRLSGDGQSVVAAKKLLAEHISVIAEAKRKGPVGRVTAADLGLGDGE